MWHVNAPSAVVLVERVITIMLGGRPRESRRESPLRDRDNLVPLRGDPGQMLLVEYAPETEIKAARVFFDDQGAVYVNTSTAGPENIRFPRQIDITRRDSSAVLKLEARTGKVLWSAEPGGLVKWVGRLKPGMV